MATTRAATRSSRVRDWLRNGVVRRLLILVLLIAAYQTWLTVQAQGKATDGVGADADAQGRFSVDLRLGFAPERFHILALQHHGRVAGSEGHIVHLRGVSD